MHALFCHFFGTQVSFDHPEQGWRSVTILYVEEIGRTIIYFREAVCIQFFLNLSYSLCFARRVIK